MIDRNTLNGSASRALADLKRFCGINFYITQPIKCCIQIVEDIVVDTNSAGKRRIYGATQAHNIRTESIRRMSDAIVSDRNIRHGGAGIVRSGLVQSLERYSSGVLGESCPDIFENVTFEQQALSVLEFKQVLYDKWTVSWLVEPDALCGISVHSADKTRLPRHP